MADSLTGVIERITFHNLDNGYCVLRVTARGHREPVTVVGHMPQAVAGEYVEAAGEWVTDRSHGQQFKASELKTTPPHTAAGIAKYLGSGLVKGIGPKYAQKIVDVFGEKTLAIIDQSPGFLTQVKGLGPKRIQQIRDGWRETAGVRAIMAFLMSYGIGTARAVRIYKTYGDTAIEKVKANPYRLSEDIWGVGFDTADKLARELGLPADSPFRARAAVRHVLKEESSSRGHVGFPEVGLLENAAALTNISPELIQAAIEALRTDDEAVRDGELVYLKPLFLAEAGVARLASQLCAGPHPLPATDADAMLEWVESRLTITLAKSQRTAVRAAVTEKFIVVTGGPGTGKTTIVRAVVEIFAAKRQRVGLAAPTGRAAKRLAEATGGEAKTIHRLLEFDAAVGGFRRNRENPLDFDLVVIDEVSMVDIVLMNQLLRAVPPYACVVLVGDVDQLPSVGPGCVLGDFIRSRAVAVSRLTEVHRQAEASYIIRAAHAVNAGEIPASAPAGVGDFYVVEADEPATVIDRIRTMIVERIPAKFGLDPRKDVQVLSPMNKSELGVQNLNKVLQEALNPPRPGGAEVQRFGTTFRPGDKVIQTQNNYQREVFNGDIGRVAEIDVVGQTLTAEFDSRIVDYDFGDLDELSLAYAVSIHKSQGSEYPAVIIPVHSQHYIMLQRNLFYTGITRGRKLVVLVGSKRALWRAVTTADTAMRFGLLADRLKQEAARGLSPAAAAE